MFAPFLTDYFLCLQCSSTSFYCFIPILAYVYAFPGIRIAAGVKGSAHLVSQDFGRMGWCKPAPRRSHFCRTDMSFMREASWEHSYVALLLCLRTEPHKEWHKNTTGKHLFVKLLSQPSLLQQGKSSVQWPKTFISLGKMGKK